MHSACRLILREQCLCVARARSTLCEPLRAGRRRLLQRGDGGAEPALGHQVLDKECRERELEAVGVAARKSRKDPIGSVRIGEKQSLVNSKRLQIN
eukprot:4086149-Pleurochrysis_carterae.AAC.1